MNCQKHSPGSQDITQLLCGRVNKAGIQEANYNTRLRRRRKPVVSQMVQLDYLAFVLPMTILCRVAWRYSCRPRCHPPPCDTVQASACWSSVARDAPGSGDQWGLGVGQGRHNPVVSRQLVVWWSRSRLERMT